jgi:hypothetical protein
MPARRRSAVCVQSRLPHRGEPTRAGRAFGDPFGSRIGNVMNDDVALIDRLNSAQWRPLRA